MVEGARRPGHDEDAELLSLVREAARLESSPAVAEASVIGAVDISLVREVVTRHDNQLRYCYQRELTRQPTLSGEVVTRFVIAADGSVSSASVKSSSLASYSVEQCVVGRFMRMQFPALVGGGIAIVQYPMLFAPA